MKPGDIVTFNAEARRQAWHSRWIELNGDSPLVLTGVIRAGEIYKFRLLNDRVIEWDSQVFGNSRGVSECWITPQPFLTAVKNAIEKEK